MKIKIQNFINEHGKKATFYVFSVAACSGIGCIVAHYTGFSGEFVAAALSAYSAVKISKVA
jgi:hypothetical protein